MKHWIATRLRRLADHLDPFEPLTAAELARRIGTVRVPIQKFWDGPEK